LIFKTFPELAALLRIDVADVEERSTVTVLPVMVVGETKFGAAIFYPQIIAVMMPPEAPPPPPGMFTVTSAPDAVAVTPAPVKFIDPTAAVICVPSSEIGMVAAAVGVAQVPSPRQKVVDDADVPELRLVTGRLPVTPVDSGSPVALVSVTAEGVPRFGVVSTGDVANTLLPVPVLITLTMFLLASKANAVLAVRPDNVVVEEAESVVNAPVVGVVAPTVPLILIEAVPVRLVTVPELGVPNAPPLTTKAPADPVFTPRAVTTPVPVVTVLGAAPAPPPTINAFAANTPELAQVDDPEK
jgi:hypothetical protein